MSRDDSAKCNKLQRSQFFASTRNSRKEKDRSKESTFVQFAQSLELDCDSITATKDFWILLKKILLGMILLKNHSAKSLSSRYLQLSYTNKETSVSYYSISSILNYRLTINYTNKETSVSYYHISSIFKLLTYILHQ